MELLRMIKTQTPTLPVLVVSAYVEDQYAVQVLKDGGMGLSTKKMCQRH
jgi:CheY-like chemotaxis protein